jgi:hypothetical protein
VSEKLQHKSLNLMEKTVQATAGGRKWQGTIGERSA